MAVTDVDGKAMVRSSQCRKVKLSDLGLLPWNLILPSVDPVALYLSYLGSFSLIPQSRGDVAVHDQVHWHPYYGFSFLWQGWLPPLFNERPLFKVQQQIGREEGGRE